MGIFRVAIDSVRGELADQWLEIVQPLELGNDIIATKGVVTNNKSKNRFSSNKGNSDVISNGSLIQVPENTFMLLVEAGKIIAATDEAGNYQVDNSRAPSLFFKAAEESNNQTSNYNNTNKGGIDRPGGLLNTIKDSFERFKFAGGTPNQAKVIFINKQEIPNIRFGTANPIIYYDRVFTSRPIPCSVRAFGSYSIKVSDPLLFYREVVSKNGADSLRIDDLSEQYIDEFLMAFSDATASLSLDNVSVAEITTRQRDLGKYMATTLDDEWLKMRGFFIHSVGIKSITFDEKTKEFMDEYMYNSQLLSANERAAEMTKRVGKGLEAAGSNENGAMMGFAGIGMGMNAAGGGLGGVMNPPNQPNQAPTGGAVGTAGAVAGWTCSCGSHNTGAFCTSCGAKKPAPAGSWTCSCGNSNTGAFCSNCGSKKPEVATVACSSCGYKPVDQSNPPNFCPSCGNKF